MEFILSLASDEWDRIDLSGFKVKERITDEWVFGGVRKGEHSYIFRTISIDSLEELMKLANLEDRQVEGVVIRTASQGFAPNDDKDVYDTPILTIYDDWIE